ncbi:hypothetical protein EGW08_016084, partial [Elysia chlorotica]
VGPDGAATAEDHAADEVGDDALHVQRQLHLHGHPLERGLFLHGFDVVDSQTDLWGDRTRCRQCHIMSWTCVHDDDAHHDDEDDEDAVGRRWVQDRVIVTVEDAIKVKLSNHHHGPYLILKQGVEGEREGDDEQEEDDEELAEREQDVGEHDHVDSEPRELLDEQNQVHPRQEHGHRAQVPLPSMAYISVSRGPLALVEADDEQQRRHVDDPLDQVGPAQVVQLGLVDL